MGNETEEEMMEDGINLLEYIIVLAKRKTMIILITLSIALLTAIYSFFLPEIYMADVTILPPGETSNRSFLMGELSNIMGIGGSSGNLSNPSVITSIIKSRAVSDRIVDRFGLMEIYGSDFRESARKILAGAVSVGSDRKSNIITISVSNEDPQLAADIANAYIEALNTRLQELTFTEASRRRLFFEEQLKQTKKNLVKSEEAMREFQEETGILRIEEQASLVINSIAGLRAQMAAKEVELKVMKTYSTANNPDLQKLQETLNGLKAELKKLEKKEGSADDTLMPTGRFPVIGTGYGRKLRDLKFNESLFEILLKQYEMAKMEEAKDSRIMQVLDEAVPPLNRYLPQRRKMIMIATAAALIFSVLLALLMESIANQQASGEDMERINRLKKYLSFK